MELVQMTHPQAGPYEHPVSRLQFEVVWKPLGWTEVKGAEPAKEKGAARNG